MSYLSLAKIFFTISILATIASIAVFIYPGPHLSIDFEGGTLMDLQGAEAPELKSALESANITPPIGSVVTNVSTDGTIIARFRNISSEEHDAVITELKQKIPGLTETRYTTIGPTVGSAVKQKAILAIILACVGIILFVAFAFRNIPSYLSPWRFGIVVVITLLHDIIVTTGIFTIFSYTSNFEVDTLFVTALLTIMGYSVNDTIVIFDRIRENVTLTKNEPFEKIATRSVKESVTRSINTSASVLIMLAALALFGPTSVQWFALTLLCGIGIGTYSSIFLATPLLIYWKKGKH